MESIDSLEGLPSMDIRGRKVGTAPHTADEEVGLADCDEYLPKGRRLRTLSKSGIQVVIRRSQRGENSGSLFSTDCPLTTTLADLSRRQTDTLCQF